MLKETDALATSRNGTGPEVKSGLFAETPTAEPLPALPNLPVGAFSDTTLAKWAQTPGAPVPKITAERGVEWLWHFRRGEIAYKIKLGELLLYMRTHHETEFDQHINDFGWDYTYIQKLCSTVERTSEVRKLLPVEENASLRGDSTNVTFSHLETVAQLSKFPRAQRDLLQEAQAQGWSVQDLREQVEEKKIELGIAKTKPKDPKKDELHFPENRQPDMQHAVVSVPTLQSDAEARRQEFPFTPARRRKIKALRLRWQDCTCDWDVINAVLDAYCSHRASELEKHFAKVDAG